jgi:pimeloyl-ACP methyl ester carboxylesterase
VSDLVRSIDGPVVLVGHSYGGATITNVAADAGDITALVYIAGYALNPGESCGDGSASLPAARWPRRCTRSR